MTLYEFGFTDFLVNEYLLKHNESLEAVANMLMNN